MTAPQDSDPAAGRRGEPASRREPVFTPQLREQYRSQTLRSIGGWSGTVVASIPTVVFVALYSFLHVSLRGAIGGAVGAAALLVGYRLSRRQPVQQAVAGVGGVVIAAAIAGATGQARNYFLLGIVTSFVYGSAFLVSMVVRRPLVGLLWEFLDPFEAAHPVPAAAVVSAAAAEAAAPVPAPAPGPGEPWHSRGPLLRAYQYATGIGAVVFLGRGVLQLALYLAGQDTWLGVTRIFVNYPLYFAALLLAFWVVRRARRGLSGLTGPPARPG